MVMKYINSFMNDIVTKFNPEDHLVDISKLGIMEPIFTASYAGQPVPLDKKVILWLKENCKGSYKTWWDYAPVKNVPVTADNFAVYYIQFQKKYDAMAFKLRWL